MSASCDLLPGFAAGLVPIGDQKTYPCAGGPGPPLPGDPPARGPQRHPSDVGAEGEPRIGQQPGRQPPGGVRELDGRGGKKKAGP